MNRKAFIIAVCTPVVVAIGLVLASPSKGVNGTPPRSECNFMVTMPLSNITAASQTNISPQIK